ncbi:hypothetical protein JCM21142_72936 [Saccharicrinis fermentans DSM 9555 = JCM 21142]|uniref:Uncharacterized protein n=1 Tax=Saccharicrinis fermentans DSM 9555 = JCM 21142 TaxID=869213 RepID=W7YPC8_9BACT|nr:hypothetical protein JCM21142_72936 [Saccharicrinis fermentans DSM 9555 = JCM 21142]
MHSTIKHAKLHLPGKKTPPYSITKLTFYPCNFLILLYITDINSLSLQIVFFYNYH